MDDRPVPLTADDAQRLGLWRVSRMGSQALVAHIAAYPRLAWRLGEDWILAGQWRGRPDIIEVLESVGRRGRGPLLDQLIQVAKECGARAVVAGAAESLRLAAEYETLGWDVIDHVVYYRFQPAGIDPQPFPGLIRPVIPEDLPTLLAIDQAAFGWLWQESESSLRAYLKYDYRVIELAEFAGRPVGYLAANSRARAANIDRLAVLPDQQGKGIGRALLTRTLAGFRRRGLMEITLNTQVTNDQSRRLYEGLGFVPIGEPRPLYGCILVPE